MKKFFDRSEPAYCHRCVGCSFPTLRFGRLIRCQRGHWVWEYEVQVIRS